MATPSERLAQSLEALAKLQTADGAAAIRAKSVPYSQGRAARPRLQPARRGWLISRRPDELKGESTALTIHPSVY